MALRDRPFDDEDLQPGDVITRSRLGLNKQAQNRRSNPNIQPETPTERPSNPGRRTLSGRHNPNMHPLDERGASNVDLTEADIEDLQRDASLVDGPQGLRRQVTSHGGRRQVRQFDNGGVAVVGSETGNFNKGGIVNTISSEAFTNPVPARFSARDQGRFGEREFAKRQAEFNRKATRDAAIESDLEFRRNLRERRLLDDANLNLSGGMTLGELASRAARRRSARATLSQREANQAELAQTQAELEQEAALEQYKEEGRNRRAELEARTGAEKADRERRIERADRAFTFAATKVNEDGESIHDPQLELRARQMVTSSGKNPDNLRADEVVKFTNTAATIQNLEQAAGISIENLNEFAAIIGFTDEELLPGFIDEEELHLINPETGQTVQKVAIDDVATTPAGQRLIRELQTKAVQGGRIPFRRRSPYAYVGGQRADLDYNVENDPEGALERQESARRRSLRERRSREVKMDPRSQIQQFR